MTIITEKRDKLSSFGENKNPIYFKGDTTVDKSLSSLQVECSQLVYTEYKPQNLGITKNKLSKRAEIDKLSRFEEILKYGIDTIKLKDDYFFNRIRELKKLCDLISLESLKTMFLFVEAIGSISKPSSLTVSESGLFYLEWERDRNNSITLRFKKDYFLEYVIFKQSLNINRRIILNGSMYVLDLIDYLNDLNIKIHKKI